MEMIRTMKEKFKMPKEDTFWHQKKLGRVNHDASFKETEQVQSLKPEKEHFGRVELGITL